MVGVNNDSLISLYTTATYKRKVPYVTRAVQGWLGGVYISIGNYYAANIAGNYLSLGSSGTALLLYAFLFPVGLLLVVFGQYADVFTSNCMLVPIALVYDVKNNASPKDRYRILDVLNVLISSWIWNFAGCLCIAYFMGYQGGYLQDPNYKSGVGLYCNYVATNQLKLSATNVLMRSWGANWLVCHAVFFAIGTKNKIEKALVI